MTRSLLAEALEREEKLKRTVEAIREYADVMIGAQRAMLSSSDVGRDLHDLIRGELGT